ncbi:MAG: hypothetical protein GY938_20445 [Ketobacter sp.]|nr:hypothetical protein [Ketobacter sp.]
MTTTIQETSKRFKLQILISILLMAFGFLIGMGEAQMGNDSSTPFGVAAFGLLWYVVTKFRIWWNHK